MSARPAMHTRLKLRLRARAEALRQIAYEVDDPEARRAIEVAARDIEAFDEDTARLFFADERSAVIWLD